jgi:transposase-like protein
MSRGKRVFSVEFKQAVVQEVLAGESQVKAAR